MATKEYATVLLGEVAGEMMESLFKGKTHTLHCHFQLANTVILTDAMLLLP